MDNKLLEEFDSAVQDRNETELFIAGQKAARIYSFRDFRNFNIACDWELIADEAVLRLLRIAKKTDWKKEARYYWGCKKKRVRYSYLNLYRNHENVASLEAFTTDADGEQFLDHLNLKPEIWERSAEEEAEL